MHTTARIKQFLSRTAVAGALAATVVGAGAQSAQALPDRTCQSMYVAQEMTWRSAEQTWQIAASLEDQGSDAYFYDMHQSYLAGMQFNRAMENLSWC